MLTVDLADVRRENPELVDFAYSLVRKIIRNTETPQERSMLARIAQIFTETDTYDDSGLYFDNV